MDHHGCPQSTSVYLWGILEPRPPTAVIKMMKMMKRFRRKIEATYHQMFHCRTGPQLADSMSSGSTLFLWSEEPECADTSVQYLTIKSWSTLHQIREITKQKKYCDMYRTSITRNKNADSTKTKECLRVQALGKFKINTVDRSKSDLASVIVVLCTSTGRARHQQC